MAIIILTLAMGCGASDNANVPTEEAARLTVPALETEEGALREANDNGNEEEDNNETHELIRRLDDLINESLRLINNRFYRENTAQHVFSSAYRVFNGYSPTGISPTTFSISDARIKEIEPLTIEFTEEPVRAYMLTRKMEASGNELPTALRSGEILLLIFEATGSRTIMGVEPPDNWFGILWDAAPEPGELASANQTVQFMYFIPADGRSGARVPVRVDDWITVRDGVNTNLFIGANRSEISIAEEAVNILKEFYYFEEICLHEHWR